ncbi:hypothetical protein DHEL01_v213127 [Diaporthe helianthi]|uniref:Uncharacterized protein n=1 Tax=Diaporthe helianthi TaxID=158607 RepID=A0A2P5HE21_DIAHE|nr:hypothetical protein DHEL01_v213127 [Diaporthe helianthi]
MPRSKALVETAYLLHRIAPGTRRHQTRRLDSTATCRNALDILKQQPTHQAATSSFQSFQSFQSSPARHYATGRSRPGPLGTAFLLFPAAAIGAGVLTGYVSLNPFSTTAKASSSSAGSMSSKLIPANPADVMVIRNITPNVVTFSVPFKRFGTIPVGGRGTVGEFFGVGLL